MTFTAEGPVVSGQMYHVTSVDGRRPERLDDFTGEVEISVMRGETSMSLLGSGTPIEGAVHLCQKERGPIDRDIRVWTVMDRGDGKFTAEPIAAF